MTKDELKFILKRRCFGCKGEGSIEAHETLHKCKTCNGRGRLESDLSFIEPLVKEIQRLNEWDNLND